MTNLDSPLVSTKQSNARTTDMFWYKIEGAYFTLCRNEKAPRGSHFSYSEASIKNFIAQSILRMNRAENRNPSVLKSSDAIINFLRGSKEPFERFNAACIQSSNTKNCTVETLFPSRWIWNSLCYMQKISRHGNWNLRLQQMIDAQIELHELDAHGDIGLSWWRLAPFDAICCNTMRSKPQETAEL